MCNSQIEMRTMSPRPCDDSYDVDYDYDYYDCVFDDDDAAED